MRRMSLLGSWTLYCVLALLAAGLVWAGTSGSTSSSAVEASQGLSATPGAPADAGRFKNAYGSLPLSFEANLGQTDPRVDFLARGPGYSVFLTGGEAVLSLRGVDAASNRNGKHKRAAKGAALRLKLVGAQAEGAVGQRALPGKVNYFVGKDPNKWCTAIPTYAQIAYPNVYPGVDVVYYGDHQGRLEHDFVVHPGTDPEIIELRFEGADSMKLNAQGDLVLETAAGAVRFQKPLIYQDMAAGRREIAGAYEHRSRNMVGFNVAKYDTSRSLIIDPVLVYSTYLGGSANELAWSIAVDASGAAYVSGSTTSADFPTTPGAFDTTLGAFGGGIDAFVTKLDPSGAALLYSTYLGGNGAETQAAPEIAVDASGAAYVSGSTASADFPTTPGAFDTSYNGGFADAFVTKLDPTGAALLYSTYLGGSSGDEAQGIAVDASGSAYITGQTLSGDFPTTVGAFDMTYNENGDVFVTKLDAAGANPVYSTYLGGSGPTDQVIGIALDSSGSAYVTGSTRSTDFPTTPGAFDTILGGLIDAFVTKLDPTGAALIYSTYLGGISGDEAQGIALDPAGEAYVTGNTGPDFPTTPGAFDTTFNLGFDAFVTKLDAAGSALVYSTYLGGNGPDIGRGIAVDPSGNAYVTGGTGSNDFPTTPGAFDTILGGLIDAFVTKLDATGAGLVYSTYLGGSAVDQTFGITVDPLGSAYLTGRANSSDFPTTPGAFDTTLAEGSDDAFVVKLCISCDQPGACCLCADDDESDDESDGDDDSDGDHRYLGVQYAVGPMSQGARQLALDPGSVDNLPSEEEEDGDCDNDHLDCQLLTGEECLAASGNFLGPEAECSDSICVVDDEDDEGDAGEDEDEDDNDGGNDDGRHESLDHIGGSNPGDRQVAPDNPHGGSVGTDSQSGPRGTRRDDTVAMVQD